MRHFTRYLAYLIKSVQKELMKIIKFYVSDTVISGDHEFIKESKQTEQNFQSRAIKFDSTTYAELKSSKQNKTIFLIKEYIPAS